MLQMGFRGFKSSKVILTVNGSNTTGDGFVLWIAHLSRGSPFGLPANSLNSVLPNSSVCQAAFSPKGIGKEEEAA